MLTTAALLGLALLGGAELTARFLRRTAPIKES